MMAGSDHMKTTVAGPAQRGRAESFDDGGGGGGNSPSGTGAFEKHSARNPACDLCREKKVRCGREKPRCQNCVMWKSTCSYSERQKRDNEASRTAQRFEEVNERLDRIEAAMNRMVDAMEAERTYRAEKEKVERESMRGGRGSDGRSPSTISISRSPGESGFTPGRFSTGETATDSPSGAVVHVSNQRGDMQYLGLSSLISISSEAESLIADRLRGSAGASPQVGGGVRVDDAETAGALRKLNLVRSKLGNLFPQYGHQKLRSAAMDAATMDIPSRSEADRLVKVYFDKVHNWFPLYDRAKFENEIGRFYEDPETLGKDRGWMACFYNILLFGLHYKMAIMPSETEEEKAARKAVSNRVRVYFYNTWKVIDDLDVFIGPRLRNVQALLSGAVCAIEVSRPGLCWSLLAQASRSCLAIGLHRSSAGSNLSPAAINERKSTFWQCYILDKCLSLGFGRAPSIPDFDCDVELPEDDGTNPLHRSYVAMIELAKIQNSIFVRLYSAQATRQSVEEREIATRELDRDLREWWDHWEPPSAGPLDRFEARVTRWLERVQLRFSLHNNMTLVHRVARPGGRDFSWSEKECIENARGAIKVVNEVVEKSAPLATNGTLLWIFQYQPFSSFFVLFSAIIRNPSLPSSSDIDLPLMNSHVAYLSLIKNRNKGAEKLLQIASAFCNVATTFLKNHKNQQQQSSTPAEEEKDKDKKHSRNLSIGTDSEQLPPGKRRRASSADHGATLPPLRLSNWPLDSVERERRTYDPARDYHHPGMSPSMGYQLAQQQQAQQAGVFLPPPTSLPQTPTPPPTSAPAFDPPPPPPPPPQQSQPLPQSTTAPDQDATGAGAGAAPGAGGVPVDFNVTSFLRWPGYTSPRGMPGSPTAAAAAGLPIVSSAPMSATPSSSGFIPQMTHGVEGMPPVNTTSGYAGGVEGGGGGMGMGGMGGMGGVGGAVGPGEPFQVQLEQAAMRGPLEFDWFLWEGEWGGGQEGTGGGGGGIMGGVGGG